MMTKTLSPELLRKMNAYWRAANYLSVGQNLSLRQSAAEEAAQAGAKSNRACSATGHDAGTELLLWVHPKRRKVKQPDGQRPEPPPMKTTLEHPPASGSEKGRSQR